MARLLKTGKITSVGLVDAGANQDAEIVIWKRASGSDTDRRTADASGADDDTLPGPLVGAHKPKETKPMSWLAKLGQTLGISDEDVAEIESAYEAEFEDDDAGEVEKSADVIALEKRLADVEKRAEQAEQTAQRLRDERENSEFIAKAAKLTHLPGVVADDFGPVLRKVRGALTADEFTKLEATLKGADEALRTSEWFGEMGRGGAGSTTVEAEVGKLVAEIRKAKPNIDEQTARAEVWLARPDLRQAYERERKQTVEARRLQGEG